MKYFFLVVLILDFWGFCARAQNPRRLGDYLEAAQANSPLLKDYQNQAEIAQLENEKVNANYRIPNIYGNAQWMEAPRVNNVGYDQAITNGGMYSAVVGAQLPLLAGGFVQAEQRQNNLQQQKAQWNQRASWRDLKLQVTEGYLICYADQQNLSNVSGQIDLLGRQIKIAETLAQAGSLKGSDVLLLQIEKQKLATTAANWHAQLLGHIADLNKLCGLVDTARVQFAGPTLALSDSLIAHSQYRLQYVLDSVSAQNQLDLFNLKYKPKVSAFADAGLNAVSPNNLPHYFGFSLGLNLTMNIFDGNQKKVAQSQTMLKQSTISAYQKQFEDQRAQSLLNLEKQVDLADARIAQIEKELGDYDKLIDIYQKALGEGDIRVTEYLVTLRTYIQEKQNLIDQQKQKYSAINAYNYWNW